ncbi:hypothetical protein [Streptomyces sp. NPDC015414]|uniref:hypothetical protein n=1 Tax=Streptomyces sp. NPDC015414 TaxID=3364957 RepID=UPI0036F6129E
MPAPTPCPIVLGRLATVPPARTGLARAIRRRGAVGGRVGAAPAAYEEALWATGHASHHEIRFRAGRKSSIGSPDGPCRGSWRGRR